MNFIKRYWLDLFLISLMAVLLFIADGPLILDPGRFDELATIGWTAVPFALCWLMFGVASTLKQHAMNATRETEASAGLVEAQMWQVRHDTKRQNDYHKGRKA